MKRLLICLLLLTTGVPVFSQPKVPTPMNNPSPIKMDKREKVTSGAAIIISAVAFTACTYYARNGTEQQYKNSQYFAVGAAVVTATFVWSFQDKKLRFRRKIKS